MIVPQPSAIIPDRRIHERRQSGVRSYARSMPRQLVRAQGVRMHDSNGGRSLAFLSVCSTTNHRHTHPVRTAALPHYVADAGLAHALALHTGVKSNFLEASDTLTI